VIDTINLDNGVTDYTTSAVTQGEEIALRLKYEHTDIKNDAIITGPIEVKE